MREMKDSGIDWVGKIPKDWRVLRNKYNFDLSKNIVGAKWAETQLLSLTKNGVKAITPEEQSGKVPTSFATYQLVGKNDIVMCLFDLDVSAVFSGLSCFDGMISPAYKCFKCKSHLLPGYADYYYRTVFVDRKYKRYSKNVRYSLGADDFLSLPMIVPRISDQYRIVAFLDSKCAEIDALSADIQSEIDTLEAYKRSVITEAVTKGLDKNAPMKDSGIDYVGIIPVSWSIKRLKYILEERNYRSETGLETLLSVSQYFGVVPSYSIQRTMQAKSLVGYKKVYPKDLVFNKLNPVLARFGVSAHTGITSPDFAVYYTDKADTRFLCYLLKTDAYIMEYGRLCTGVGDGFSRLYTPMLYNIKIAVPSLKEQCIIADYLDSTCAEIDAIIAQKQEQLAVLADYKKSIIYEYVTGKKEVPVA